MDIRVGYGYDLHRLAEGRRCVIGGVEIPFERGLEGHSDADVLLHAITDALLGAVAMGDIGTHFPDSDPEWKDADSGELLGSIGTKVKDAGWRIVNVDATVIAEAPQLNPYIRQIRESVGSILDIGAECVSVKATTSEKVGFLGRGEAIAAHAVLLVRTDS